MTQDDTSADDSAIDDEERQRFLAIIKRAAAEIDEDHPRGYWQAVRQAMRESETATRH